MLMVRQGWFRNFRSEAPKLRSSSRQELQSVNEARVSETLKLESSELESSGASASAKLRSSSRQELQSVSEALNLESSRASERQPSSKARVVRQRSSEARVVRSFRVSAKLRSSSRQELQRVSEARKLESSRASECQ